ncbi:hypothetical protein [Salinibacter ruber]|uniref:Uncharacterized protein n=1 Tax=Salinibacter ruber TaxID=146919 RepID=A0A9X2Q8T6_9BACT|nr:hypothetical protein [Salinibacter ruber]MCS3661793.1 hypothetical protein [Salinibacter ruber]MCS3711546.1 hypothetical protein [Salinibacter ruber]
MRNFKNIENEKRRRYTYDVDEVSKRVVVIQNPTALHVKDSGAHVILAQGPFGNFTEKIIEPGWENQDIVFKEDTIQAKAKYPFEETRSVEKVDRLDRVDASGGVGLGVVGSGAGIGSVASAAADKTARDVMDQGMDEDTSITELPCLEHEADEVPPEDVCGFYPSCGCSTTIKSCCQDHPVENGGDGGEGEPPNPDFSETPQF